VNILTVVNGLTRSGGGASLCIPELNNALAVQGVHCSLVSVLTKEGEQCLPDPKLVDFTMVERLRTWGRQLNWAPGLKPLLEKKIKEIPVDLIHSQGVWSLPNHTASGLARKYRIPLVVSPHGSLTGWSFRHKGWKKRIAWAAYQKHDLEGARVIHATADNEADDLRALGLKNPIAIIPNGVDIPKLKTLPAPDGQRVRKALFLSRIYPKKGLLNLVEAWAALKPVGWKMVIAGPDPAGHRAEVEKAIQAFRVEKDFEFAGEVYDDAKWDLYQSSDVFVLPTFSENFGIVIAEALACGVPVITTEGTPWAELPEHGCGWWIPVGVPPLVEALREALALSDDQRRQMGLRGRQLMIEKYSWESAAKGMKTLYEWILNGGPPPPFIRF
jgi:glycosyltransferase involved in cell wall biosynthesis